MPQNYPTSLHLGWEGPAPQQGRGFAIKETAAQGEGVSRRCPPGRELRLSWPPGFGSGKAPPAQRQPREGGHLSDTLYVVLQVSAWYFDLK